MRPQFATAALLLLASAASAGAQTVHGRVLERGSDAPISAVTVELRDGDMVRARVQTDSAGLFDLDIPGAGTYRLSAERVGYTSVLSEHVLVGSLDSLDVLFHMATDAVVLQPVRVTAGKRFTSPLIAAFYERAGNRRQGRFMTRVQIANIRSVRTSDVLRRMAGLSMRPTRRGGMALRARGGCEPLVFIDGMHVNMYGAAFTVDDLVRPDDLEGIEVYSGASIPIQFVRDGPGGTQCGAVMLWTKQRV
ncbi:MAG TPA: carboxypeptidase regulatory-like domain-containing protein [Longimicrobium sp.]|nr:carboxypeptidase regulatory-like domain-containing protein [Longimicrobium sp.]